MWRKYKRVLAALVTLVILASTVVAGWMSFASNPVIYKPNPILATLGVTEADAQPVATFAEFKTAVEAGKPVRLTANITATGNVGSTSKYIDKDIVVFGKDFTLDMGANQFLLTGSHTLYLSDLKINTASSNSTHRYGLFCLRAGSATTSNYVWESGFHNLTFQGSALLGTYNTDDYTGTKRMFNSANFSGDTLINITSAYSAHIAVVSARNINISGAFDMMDSITGTNTGATSPTYQYYFKSAGTGGTSSEANNNVAHGLFNIEEGARVNINRSPGRGTDGQTSAYYRSLIYGYSDHVFGEGASFTAKAGTNLTSASGLEYRSAVIRSNNANSFIVASNATVKLETDLFNYTSAAEKNGSYGYTALSLKKSGALEIRVDPGATLDILADGRNTSPSYGTRAQAPVVIWGSGSSSTTVFGDLNVYSENGNGWYYAYSTSAAGRASFTVEGTGRVDIRANNLGVKGADEYAAFEAYGKYDVDITVRDGGKMNVFSNGYRGMSLASSGGYNSKSIHVTGEGSELNISGVHWAIAAETQPVLSIVADDGGKIDLATTGDVGDGYSNAGSAPSTVYSVGPTTYKVDGPGSEINVYHSGGTYSAIFHDGYGALNVLVTDGGAMDVYNRNSGTDTSARRAAITAQSTNLGSYKSNDNLILVDGADSSLRIVNENPNTHGNGGDTGLYPTGAVSFNSSAKGNVRVSNGGNFQAVSSSLAPTVHLYEGTITFDNPGEFEIRNNALSSSGGKNNSYATFGQAVYNERYRNGSKYYDAIEFIDCDVTVWSVLENDYNYDADYIDNYWQEVTFSANNKTIATAGKDGGGGDTTLALNQFDLSAYGRINGSGEGSGGNLEISDPPLIHDVYNGQEAHLTGMGVPGASVTVTFQGGWETTVVVGPTGLWWIDIDDVYNSGEELNVGDVIQATQTEPGKLPSELVYNTVKQAISGASIVYPIYEGDDEIFGIGVPGAEILVELPSGETLTAQIGLFSPVWSVPCDSEALTAGDLVEVYQREVGKEESDATVVPVIAWGGSSASDNDEEDRDVEDREVDDTELPASDGELDDRDPIKNVSDIPDEEVPLADVIDDADDLQDDEPVDENGDENGEEF